MITISVANFAGGQGKTTLSILLAQLLKNSGKRVLLVDADPQGNASLFSGATVNPQTYTLLEAFRNNQIRECVEADGGYSVLPSDRGLAEAEFLLSSSPGAATKLRRMLKAVEEYFDCVVVDSPPQGLNLSQTAVCAADWLYIPAEVAWKGVEGAIKTRDTVLELTDAELFKGAISALVPFRDRWVGQHRVNACRKPMASLEKLSEEWGVPIPLVLPECADFPLALSEQRLPKTNIELGNLLVQVSAEAPAIAA